MQDATDFVLTLNSYPSNNGNFALRRALQLVNVSTGEAEGFSCREGYCEEGLPK